MVKIGKKGLSTHILTFNLHEVTTKKKLEKTFDVNGLKFTTIKRTEEKKTNKHTKCKMSAAKKERKCVRTLEFHHVR